jgi:DNA-binding transcriptional LysR family regulator
MDLELRHFRNFLAVAEERSFTGAGKRLHVSQPTLTRSIHTMEDALGVCLFDRNARPINLTAEGERLRAVLVPLLKQLDTALAGIRKQAGLRVGFSWLVPDGWSQLAAEFRKETSVRVEFVRCDSPLAGLDDGEADLVLLRGAPPPQGLRGVPLCEEPRVAAVSSASPLAGRRVLSWAELAEWPLVVNTVSGTTRPELWPEGNRPRVAAVCRNYDEWLELVAADEGVGTVPASAARRHIHPDVRFIRIRDAPPLRVHLAFPAHGAHPHAARFAELAWHAFAGVRREATPK